MHHEISQQLTCCIFYNQSAINKKNSVIVSHLQSANYAKQPVPAGGSLLESLGGSLLEGLGGSLLEA
jgi:hypothetical protein